MLINVSTLLSNTMKKNLILLMLMVTFAGTFFAFRTYSATEKYMLVTTIESIIPGGLGRSKMLIHDENGKTTEVEMENLYSMVGIQFKNITTNNVMVLNKINEMCGGGWSLHSVVTGVQSPDGDKGGQGIYMTRYYFKKSN